VIDMRVLGVGLWAPGFVNAAAWLAGEADPNAQRPKTELVGPRLRKGTSLVTRMSVEAAVQAAEQAGLDLAVTPIVFGSAYGEINIAIEQLDAMREGEGFVSPLRFKNSVHNTAPGILSIAAGNRGMATALAGGAHTFRSVLIESHCLVATGQPAVLAIVSDEPLPAPLDQRCRYEGLAVALALASDAPAGGGLGRLHNMRRGAATPERVATSRWARNPAAASLGVLDAVIRRHAGTIPITLDGDESWCIDYVLP